MNEVEYILRIVLKARDELAGALKRAREELRLFANAADSDTKKINALNESLKNLSINAENITDKFREWRDILRGAGDDSAKTKRSVDSLVKSVDETGKATKRQADEQERAVRAQKELLKSADALRAEYRKLHEEEKRTDEDRAFAIFRLKDIGAELERFAKKVNDPDIKRFWFRWSQEAKESAETIKRAQDEVTKNQADELKKQIADHDAANKFMEKATKAHVQEQIRVRERLVKTYNTLISNGLQQQIALEAQAAKESEKIEREKTDRKIANRKRDDDAYKASVAQRAHLDRLTSGKADFLDIGRASETVRELRRVSNEYSNTSKSQRRLRDDAIRLEHALRNVNKEGDRGSSVFSKLRSVIGGNSDSVSTLDNKLRGLGLLLVVGFAQQLINVLGGLAGAFVAVGSSAAMAGASIGGMFVAGIGQALPAIGLLGAALVRVKSVMDAVNQAQMAEQQGAVQAATAHRRVADAADTLREAQERLRKARKEAKDDLEDLIDTEREAELAAIGAALSQEEAQKELREAIATGGDVQRAQLGVLEANARAEEAIEERRRSRRESRTAQRTGPEGMPGVQQASQQLETAKRNAQEAAQGTETAVAKLNYLITQLSPAERKLYEAVTRFQTLFRTGVYREITDNLVSSFARSVNKITDILQRPDILNAARKTSQALAAQMNRVFDALTSDKMIGQFVRIADAGRKNLKPLADIAIDVGKALANIAETAGPSFRRFLGFVGDLVGKFLDLTENRSAMEEFFDTGEKHLEAWVKLGVAIIRFFAALMGAGGAREGLTTIEDATKALDDLTKKVQDNAGKVGQFFADSREILYEVVGVVKALVIELSEAWTPERVHDFATLLKDVVIPALGDVIEFLGNVTQKVIEIADTPVGGQIIRFGVAVLLVSKIVASTVGAFVEFARTLVFIFEPVVGFVEWLLAEGTLASIGRTLKTIMGFLRSGGFVKGVGIPGLILALLGWLGLLDDAWREVKSAFMAFWREVQPSLEDFIVQFKDLWEAVTEGKGAFGFIADAFGALRTVLRPIVKLLVEIGGVILRVFGRWLGRIIGGAIDILSGLIQFITGVFTGDWEKAWDGIKKIFRGIWRLITAPFRALPELLLGIGKKLLPALRSGVEALWDWLKKLPKRLGNLAVDAAKAFVEGFKSVGGDIIKGIGAGLKEGAQFIDQFVNALIDLINNALPNKIDIPGPIGSINLPDNPIPHLATGGYIGGRYSRGDRYTVKVAGEEVILNPTQQSIIGRDKIMATLRATGAQFLRPGGSYQGGAKGQEAASGTLTISFEGGSLQEFSEAWRDFWEFLVLIARRGATLVAAQFREMRNATARSMDRIYRDIRGSLADIERSFNVRGKRIVKSWAETFKDLMNITHKGLNYIGHETNKSLTAFGAKHIDFGFTEPPNSGKAAGGFIAGKGHRGRDMGLYALGDGEAVLNWQHQKYVEPAMHAYYGHGLIDMFNRTHGYHAGGAGQGFASGGLTGPQGSGAAFTAIANFAKKKFGLTMTAGRTDHNYNTSSGNVSDHSWGGAGDFSNASSPTPQMDAFNAFWLNKAPQVIKQLIWRGKDQQGGFAIEDHFDHVHLAVQRALAFNLPRMARIISRASRGLDISDLLAGVQSGGEFTVDHVDVPDVGGKGPMATLLKKLLKKVASAANNYIDKKAGELGPGTTGGDVPNFTGPWVDVMNKIAKAKGWSVKDWKDLIQGESGGDPTARNPSSGAFGIGQFLGSTLTAYAKYGSTSTDPSRQIHAMGQYISDRYGTPTNAYHTWLSRSPHWYAEGGVVPGGEGTPVPIVAHAQEWVLNALQQQRIANMLGTSRDALKSVLGFYGGGGSYQGGGEPGAQEIAPLTRANVRGIDDRRLRALVVLLRQLDRKFVSMIENVRPVGVFVDRLDKMLDSTAKLGRRLGRTKDESDRSRGVRAFLEGMESLTGEGGLFDKLRAQIELRTERVARNLQRGQFGVRTNARGRLIVRRVRDDVQVARADLRAERGATEGLRDERAAIARGLREVRQRQRQKGLTDRQRQRLQAQENDLRTRLEEARQRIVDNVATIYDKQQALQDAIEAQQQAIIDALNTQVENINNIASRRLGRLDLAGRMLDAVGALGLGASATVAGAGFSRSSIFAGRETALRTQQTGLTAQLATARGTKGAEELVASLEDQLAELEVAIKENSKALFDARVEDVNARAGFALNINDLNKQLIELDGQIAGNTNQAALLLKAQERQAILVKQGNELTALLAETTPGTQQWQDLQIAVLENSIAQRQNTIATNELTGATQEPQTFTSSAWARFREAIFNGMGQVLPQYNPQNMMGEVNTGAVIIPGGSTSSTRTSGDTNITVYEAGRPVDVEEISGAVTFASKTAQ